MSKRIIRWLFLLPLVSLLARASDFQPALLITPDASRLSLDQIGLYAVGYQYRGQAEHHFPAGWTGGFETRTGIALQPAGEQNGRAAFLMHPPWRGGTGTTFQEFKIRLPPASEVQQILISGATAMRKDSLSVPGEAMKSDGVTFRIFANGRQLLNEHRADAIWRNFSFDLTDLAGQIVTLRFETDPGPQNNSAFDFGLWGDRELVLKGFKPKSPAHNITPPALDLRKLYSTANGQVAPISGFAGQITIQVNSNNVCLTYQGDDGTLLYRWRPPQSAVDPPLGQWQLEATAKGHAEIATVPFAGDAQVDWKQPATFKHSWVENTTDGVTCVETYEIDGQTVTLTINAKLIGKSIVMDLNCDSPQITSLAAGHWGPVLRRRQIAVPYFSGQIFYLESENLFVSAFLDWTHSSASLQDGTCADYQARTDGTRTPLHERVVFSAAWHLAETLPNIPNPPSPFREHLGGKIVLDVWGGKFEDIARHLAVLGGYGLKHCAVIIHDWQRSGYDNALPAHVPANEKLGGDAGMKKLVTVAKNLGYDIALHENYVDYYPNYEGFDVADIALDSNSNRVKAWFNPSTKIQSFAVQPHAILRLAHSQSPQILARYHPNADYLDVHSAVPPWFHVDDRAGAAEAAMFRPVWEAHRQLWAFERKTYGGPVFGEGANHWYWSGLVDGVEAQFGAGWPANAGQTAPLMVDFDLLKIHPLQFNHGMGYYERWWNLPTWGSVPPMEVLDQYRMQEIIYGHAGFLGGAAYANVPLAWLEYHLLSPVSERYATAEPVNIEYQVDKRWVDSSAAAKAGSWNRVRVTYNNGLTITANQDTNSLQIGHVVLPRFGWFAEGAGVKAWTAELQGMIADFAETEGSTFANARAVADWNQSGIYNIRPSVAKFQQVGNRVFELSYEWKLGERLPSDYQCFVHFVRKEDIVFQNDHPLPHPTSTWHADDILQDGPHRIHLPDELPDGDYDIRMGLYNPDAGRLALRGSSDGQDRIRAGTLHVREHGQSIQFEADSAEADQNEDIYQHHLNLTGKIFDFGDVRTDGSVALQREGEEWVLRTLPRTRNFFVSLKAERFGNPLTVRCLNGASDTIKPRLRDGWWQLPLNGAKEYRW